MRPFLGGKKRKIFFVVHTLLWEYNSLSWNVFVNVLETATEYCTDITILWPILGQLGHMQQGDGLKRVMWKEGVESSMKFLNFFFPVSYLKPAFLHLSLPFHTYSFLFNYFYAFFLDDLFQNFSEKSFSLNVSTQSCHCGNITASIFPLITENQSGQVPWSGRRSQSALQSTESRIFFRLK